MGGLHGIYEFWFNEYVIRKSEFSIASSGKSLAIMRPARALIRGRNAIVTERRRELRWTLWRQVSFTGRKRLQRTAKSCGPGAATLALRRRDHSCRQRGQ
jgi:hypothetical protein